jgi:hypothetical protein
MLVERRPVGKRREVEAGGQREREERCVGLRFSPRWIYVRHKPEKASATNVWSHAHTGPTVIEFSKEATSEKKRGESNGGKSWWGSKRNCFTASDGQRACAPGDGLVARVVLRHLRIEQEGDGIPVDGFNMSRSPRKPDCKNAKRPHHLAIVHRWRETSR